MVFGKILMAGAAVAVLVAGTSSSFAQSSRHRMKADAHPLTVSPAPPPPPAVPLVDPLLGIGTGVVSGAVTGAASVATAPFYGLTGTAPGISTMGAPPLPIKARYANTGPVSASYDEGFAQDVPVDKSGPIYKIDNTGHDRTVTPFSLVVFPVTAATYAITSPLRPMVHP